MLRGSWEGCVVLWLASCGLIGVPSASVEGVALTRMGLRDAAFDVTVSVHNPMWVDAHVDGLRWSLNVAQETVAKGASTRPAVLAAQSSSPVVVPVELTYAQLWKGLGNTFSGQEIPYRLSLELDTVTPTGLVTVPMVHEGTLPALRPPEIDIVDLDWEIEPDGRLRLDLGIDLSLPEQFSVNRLDWTVDVDGRVFGSGSVVIQADGMLRFPVRLDAVGAAEAGWNWLWGSAHRLQLALDGTLGTPFGPVPLSTRGSIALREQTTPPEP